MKSNNNKKVVKNQSKPFPKELGGRSGPEPTRYGIQTPEWEKNGRVSDF